jgi:tRNA(adenine34) deaminase
MKSASGGVRDDLHYMQLALAEARAAAAVGDVPVGAVLIDRHGAVLATGRNRREELGDPTAHAEMVALRARAGEGNWRQEATTLYVTLEPCPMCMGALLLARVERLVFGATDPKAGAAVSLYRMAEDPRLNHRMDMGGGVLAKECGALLSEFFKALRAARGDQQGGEYLER